MKNGEFSTMSGLFSAMHNFVKETDIRVLVFMPPVLALAILIGCALIRGAQPTAPAQPPVPNLLLGIAFLIASLSGVAEIYRREMPGPFGGILKGRIAIVSGTLLILLFGSLGLYGILRAAL